MPLVLTRRQGESIRITTATGEVIHVLVRELDHRQNRAKLSISAPLKIRVDREEVARAIDAKESRRVDEAAAGMAAGSVVAAAG